MKNQIFLILFILCGLNSYSQQLKFGRPNPYDIEYINIHLDCWTTTNNKSSIGIGAEKLFEISDRVTLRGGAGLNFLSEKTDNFFVSAGFQYNFHPYSIVLFPLQTRGYYNPKVLERPVGLGIIYSPVPEFEFLTQLEYQFYDDISFWGANVLDVSIRIRYNFLRIYDNDLN